MLLIEGTSEEPLGIEEGGGRVREKLSLTRTDKGCGGLDLCETQTSKDHPHSREDGVVDLGVLIFPHHEQKWLLGKGELVTWGTTSKFFIEASLKLDRQNTATIPFITLGLLNALNECFKLLLPPILSLHLLPITFCIL